VTVCVCVCVCVCVSAYVLRRTMYGQLSRLSHDHHCHSAAQVVAAQRAYVITARNPFFTATATVLVEVKAGACVRAHSVRPYVH